MAMNFKAAELPVVVFNTGGVGDHLLALPAFRALTAYFGDKLRVVCTRGTGRVFFTHMRSDSIIETEVLDQYGSPMFLRTFGGTNGGATPPPVHRGACHWTIDADQVASQIKHCDLLMFLNLHYSRSAVVLCKRLRPRLSIGFFSDFDVAIHNNLSQHVIDRLFCLPKLFDHELTPETFLKSSVTSSAALANAQRLLHAVPNSYRVVTIHVDTLNAKMWPIHRLTSFLTMLLDSYRDVVTFVLGLTPVRINNAYDQRIVNCIPIDLSVALALAGMAEAFVGVDSCMLHAADLHLVPGVGLFGPTSSLHWGFRFAAHRHVERQSMDLISEHDVLSAVGAILRR